MINNKLQELLSDEELMALSGGYTSSFPTGFPIVVAAYAIVASALALTKPSPIFSAASIAIATAVAALKK